MRNQSQGMRNECRHGLPDKKQTRSGYNYFYDTALYFEITDVKKSGKNE